jgi:hypothetical protein
MLVKELRDLIKPIKGANNLYYCDKHFKFIYPNCSVFGFIDTEFDLSREFMVGYLDDLYKTLDDKKILENEIVVNYDHLTDSDESFVYPLFEPDNTQEIEIIKPSNMLEELDLNIKIKFDEMKIAPNGVFIEKNSSNYKKRLNKNEHPYYISISYDNKIQLLPKTKYKYAIGNSELILLLEDTFDTYFYVTLDTRRETETNSIIDSYLSDLDI